MHYFLILTLPFLPLLHAQINSSLLNNVTQAFSQAQIVPDLLSSFTPMDLVNITFPATMSADMVNVMPGSLLTEIQTAMEPVFSLIQDDTTTLMGNETFVLALVDPDVPSPQGTDKTEFLHFLGANFSVDPTSSNLVNQSTALFEWFPPTPPPGDPPHRYVLVVYIQPDSFSDIVATLINASTQRLGFDFSAFTDATNLISPLAGNYFLVGPDNSTSTTPTSAIPSTTISSPMTQLSTTISSPMTQFSATISSPMTQISSMAPLSSFSGTSTTVVVSTSTAVPAPTPTSTNNVIGYPRPMIHSISFVILVLARELF